MEFRLSDQTIAFSVDVARATMGVDALYRRETGFTDLHDGLVVLNMANVEPAAYESYQAAQSHLAELAQKALALPEPDREPGEIGAAARDYHRYMDPLWARYDAVKKRRREAGVPASVLEARRAGLSDREWCALLAERGL